MTSFGKLAGILGILYYRRLFASLAAAYLILFLFALQDLSMGGRGVQFLTVEGERMFQRTGTFTFEPIAQVTVPGLTLLLSPLNLLGGLLISTLAGLNLTITALALREPTACSFSRTGGILAGVPALLAGSACCAPAVVLILGLQASSLLIGVFQVLLPLSGVLLLITLKLILDRTEPGHLAR